MTTQTPASTDGNGAGRQGQPGKGNSGSNTRGKVKFGTTIDQDGVTITAGGEVRAGVVTGGVQVSNYRSFDGSVTANGLEVSGQLRSCRRQLFT